MKHPRLSALGIAVLCCLLVAGCGLGIADPVPFPSPPGGYVKAVGTQLSVGGQPFRFEGLDIYMAASRGRCGGTINLSRVLNQIGKHQNVFRVWFFQSFAVSHGHFDWRPFDQLLAEAAQHGERVIVTLANQWNYCDGPEKTLGWWQSGYRNQVFPGDLVTYRQWVTDVVSRYRNDSTVAMWQLVNEGAAETAPGVCNEAAAVAAMSAFATAMAGLVHSLDHHHLVSLGNVPGYCGDMGPDYQTLNAVAGINVCDYHDYGAPASPLGQSGPNGLLAAIAACHADGKPVMVSETGILLTDSKQLALRASEFRAKLTAQFAAGVVGELMWSWVNATTIVVPATPEDYGIGPGDPSLKVLGHY